MLDRLLKKFGFPFFHLNRQVNEFLRKLSNKNKEVKENDSSFVPVIPNGLTFGMKYDN
jgi:hypothetical protein